MLTVEIAKLDNKEPSEKVVISFDKYGLELLAEKLNLLLKKKTDHLDLFSESWGDGELSSNLQDSSSVPCNHLKLMLVE